MAPWCILMMATQVPSLRLSWDFGGLFQRTIESSGSRIGSISVCSNTMERPVVVRGLANDADMGGALKMPTSTTPAPVGKHSDGIYRE